MTSLPISTKISQKRDDAEILRKQGLDLVDKMVSGGDDDTLLETNEFDSQYTEDLDLEKSLEELQETYTAVEHTFDVIPLAVTVTASPDQKAAMRDMLTKLSRDMPGFWEVLKDMGVENPIKEAHGQLEKVRQCLSGMQRKINAMSQKFDDLQRQTSLQESAPAASAPLDTRETVDVSIQTDAVIPNPPVIVQMPPSEDKSKDRMAKVGSFLSDRFLPGISITDDLCRDMTSIMTLSATSVIERRAQIGRWLKWAPTHAFPDTARPKDAVDFLVMCHGQIEKISYCAFHEIVVDLLEANAKDRQAALVTIDVALRTMLTRARMQKVPDGNLAFTALRAIELLLTYFTSPSDRSRLSKLFSEVSVRLRLEQLKEDVLVMGLRQYLEKFIAGIEPKSPLDWILDHADKTGQILPPSTRGGTYFIAHKEQVLVLSAKQGTGNVTAHAVHMEYSDGDFFLLLANPPSKGGCNRFEIGQSHEEQYLRCFPSAVQALADRTKACK